MEKLEPLWDLVIRAKRVSALLPVLEAGRRTAPDSAAEGLPEPVSTRVQAGRALMDPE